MDEELFDIYFALIVYPPRPPTPKPDLSPLSGSLSLSGSLDF